MKRLLRTICFFVFLAKIGAQDPSFIHYDVGNGLPSNLIYSIAQDQTGFLWFGTDKGLARFDGKRFLTFGVRDGLPDQEILNLKTDKSGRLWISPFQQNPCYWKNGQFHTPTTDSLLQKISLSNSSIDFQELPDGSLWIFSMTKNAYILNHDTIKTIQSLEDCPRKLMIVEGKTYNLGSNYITEINQNGTDKIVFNLTSQFGENKLNEDFEGIDFYENLILYSWKKQLILLENNGGVFRILDRKNFFFGRVFSIGEDCFWVCNNGTGAALIDCSKRKIEIRKKVLEGKKVNSFIKDQQNTFWFGTIDDGIYGLPPLTPVSFTKKQHLLSENITSIATTLGNKLILGDDEGNIYSIEHNSIIHLNKDNTKRYNRVLQLLLDKEGNGFIGTDKEIFEFSESRLKKFYNPIRKSTPLPPKSLVFSNGRLWIAYAFQVSSYENGKFSDYTVKKRRYTSIGADFENNIWAGGIDGFYSKKDNFIKNWGSEFPELSARIITIRKGNGNYLWVATTRSDLLRVYVSGGEVKNVEVMNHNFSTPIHNIKSILVDNSDNLWLGTNQGIFSVSNKYKITHYDKNDGIADNDINALVLQEDTLWVGTTKGLTKIQVRENESISFFKTNISSIQYFVGSNPVHKSFFEDQSPEKSITCPPNASLIQIQLSGLDFTSRGNLSFECFQKPELPPLIDLTLGNIIELLKNSQQDFFQTISDASLNFNTRLKPGKYKFQFFAINTRGIRSDIPDSIFIIQQPYWYETIWFWISIWIILGLGVRRIYRDRMAYRDLNAAVSNLRLQALQAQMNPHFIGNSIYAIQQFFYPPDPEKASEYIEIFNRLLRQSMLMVEQHFVHFQEDLSYYKDYLKMIKLRFGDRFDFYISGEGSIPPTAPFPGMLLQPIIENATIHGLATGGLSVLAIDFTKEGDFLQCVITDNGAGILVAQERARKSGITRKSKGLEILRQKVDTLNRLYPIELTLEILDLSTITPQLNGTRAILRYNLAKADSLNVLTSNQL